ncbi:DnaJ-domain-containing protein [Artomyces pyxidatus]|uniref:DnaJ-domain-containing protein n=1 Tax=Artomyces pyxidatus TaxID=48021 RepID=A0ACB8T8M8_9AGAM|nr:DnaJ-domain-containing protein [Artomyces pyxidatus]
MSLPANGSTSSSGGNTSPFHEKDFLYTVLNLPTTASENEIREQYRHLSVVFHPDKQRDERTKDTASKRFLEIQKAYEVLSDPFLRSVYDVYGYGGLNLSWDPELRSKSGDELRETLTSARRDHIRHTLEDSILPEGRLTLNIDARSTFEPYARVSWTESLLDRIQNMQLSTFALRHSFKRELDKKTRVIVASRITHKRTGTGPQGQTSENLLGTVRHQYSPRLNFEATASLLHIRSFAVKGTYQDDEGAFTVQTMVSPFQRVLRPPPFTLSYSRRLFKNSLTHGVLSLHTGTETYFSANIVSPTAFDTADQSFDQRPTNGPWSRLGSVSGLGQGVRHLTYGFTLAGVASSVRAQWGVVLSELALDVSLGLQYGFTGLSYVLTGAWGDQQSGVTATVAVNAAGVDLRLMLSYLGQQLVLPVHLADEYDPSLAALTTALPTATFILAYHFFLKPRRRRQRAAFFRMVRKEITEDRSSLRREVEETVSLLKETARKHMLTEKAKEGLIIMEATYGPTDPDPEARDLIVDVTIPLQALVHKSQLYIPGHRPKSGIQGFYDPAPSCAKSLRIRYLFDGRTHYAEIPDYIPVVLPLEGECQLPGFVPNAIVHSLLSGQPIDHLVSAAL